MTPAASSWPALLHPPGPVADERGWEDWFARIASRLVNDCLLQAGGKAHRFVEVEFYYHATAHPDPFTHCDPLQHECGRWYFHRRGGTYRSGSFKGLDLTFGDGSAFGGVLIRGIESAEGTLIDGPSLCVDHLLSVTGCKTVAELDAAITGRSAWDSENPLRLEDSPIPGERPLFRSARVGLSLKRATGPSEMTQFILRRYRHLSEPRRVAKGKLLLVLSLHAQGRDPDAVSRLTGCPLPTVRRYLGDYEAGRREADFTPYLGIDLTPRDLCRLHGTWDARR